MYINDCPLFKRMLNDIKWMKLMKWFYYYKLNKFIQIYLNFKSIIQN